MERIEEGLIIECLACHARYVATPEELLDGTVDEKRSCTHCGNMIPLSIWNRALEAFSSYHELNKAQLNYNKNRGGIGFFFGYEAPGFEKLSVEDFYALTGTGGRG